MNSARLHTDLAHSDATPTESMVSLPPFDGRDSDGKPRVLSRQAEDTAYMAPEMVAAKLRALYKEPHYCRTVNCENEVDHCGDHCPRCTSEIEALRKQYTEQDCKARRIGWEAIVVVLMFVVALFVGCAWLGKLLRGWL